MEEEEPEKEEGVRAVGGKASPRVMEGEGFRREDSSNRWRMMKTDIMVDRRTSITVDLSRVTEMETRCSLLLGDCMGMSARRQL